ncbi:MAG: hypothetical protein Q9188_003467, partial [Gyalolechia gomerana]
MTVSITDVGVSMTMMKISAPTAVTSVSASPMPLTFGLEFEHILLFHSSLLLPHLAHGTEIKKALPHVTRLALRQTTSQYQLSRPIYNGWGLTSPTDYTSPFGDGWHNDCLEQYGVRGYADEILRVEKMILEKRMGKESNVAVHDGRGKMKNFENWHLVTDTSLVGATPEELSSLLAATTITTTTPSNDTDTHTHIDIDIEEWDSSPVELVSRVLPLDYYNAEASFHEINTMLTHLLGSNDTLHRAFTDQHCGLHIHIGIPTGFSLPLLQHLAYILTIYEPALSSLHPAWRRPGHKGAEVDLRGNREAFYEEPDFSAVDWESWDLEMEIDGGGRDSGYASREDDDGGDVDDGVVLDFPFPKDGEGREWDGDGYVDVDDEDERFELAIQRKARE